MTEDESSLTRRNRKSLSLRLALCLTTTRQVFQEVQDTPLRGLSYLSVMTGELGSLPVEWQGLSVILAAERARAK